MFSVLSTNHMEVFFFCNHSPLTNNQNTWSGVEYLKKKKKKEKWRAFHNTHVVHGSRKVSVVVEWFNYFYYFSTSSFNKKIRKRKVSKHNFKATNKVWKSTCFFQFTFPFHFINFFLSLNFEKVRQGIFLCISIFLFHFLFIKYK